MTLTNTADTAINAGLSDMALDRESAIRVFQARLLRARQAKGWNQHDLAKASGLGKDIISQYSNAKAMPREDSILKLANALGVKPSELIPSINDEVYSGADPAGRTSPFEIRVVPGDPTRALLRADLIIPTGLAIRIVGLLQAEVEAQAAQSAENNMAS